MASNSDYAECILRLRNDEYAVLGLARGCSLHEARAVYKRLALSFHPDKADGVSPKQAQEVFHVITEAYNRIIQRLESAQRQHAMHGQRKAQNRWAAFVDDGTSTWGQGAPQTINHGQAPQGRGQQTGPSTWGADHHAAQVMRASAGVPAWQHPRPGTAPTTTAAVPSAVEQPSGGPATAAEDMHHDRLDAAATAYAAGAEAAGPQQGLHDATDNAWAPPVASQLVRPMHAAAAAAVAHVFATRASARKAGNGSSSSSSGNGYDSGSDSPPEWDSNSSEGEGAEHVGDGYPGSSAGCVAAEGSRDNAAGQGRSAMGQRNRPRRLGRHAGNGVSVLMQTHYPALYAASCHAQPAVHVHSASPHDTQYEAGAEHDHFGKPRTARLADTTGAAALGGEPVWNYVESLSQQGPDVWGRSAAAPVPVHRGMHINSCQAVPSLVPIAAGTGLSPSGAGMQEPTVTHVIRRDALPEDVGELVAGAATEAFHPVTQLLQPKQRASMRGSSAPAAALPGHSSKRPRLNIQPTGHFLQPEHSEHHCGLPEAWSEQLVPQSQPTGVNRAAGSGTSTYALGPQQAKGSYSILIGAAAYDIEAAVLVPHCAGPANLHQAATIAIECNAAYGQAPWQQQPSVLPPLEPSLGPASGGVPNEAVLAEWIPWAEPHSLAACLDRQAGALKAPGLAQDAAALHEVSAEEEDEGEEEQRAVGEEVDEGTDVVHAFVNQVAHTATCTAQHAASAQLKAAKAAMLGKVFGGRRRRGSVKGKRSGSSKTSAATKPGSKALAVPIPAAGPVRGSGGRAKSAGGVVVGSVPSCTGRPASAGASVGGQGSKRPLGTVSIHSFFGRAAVNGIKRE